MTHMILAAALSAVMPSHEDSVAYRIPRAPLSRAVTFAARHPATAAVPTVASVGDDKVQHAFMSFAVGVFAYGAARSADIDADAASAGALGASVAVGIGKEIFDARHGRPFSGSDLAADALGALAAYALTRQVR